MATKKPETEAEAKSVKKEEDERVMVMVPYIDGQDPEVTVIINGRITKFRKGETVYVPKNVAKVLEDSNKQALVARRNRQKFKEQVTDL